MQLAQIESLLSQHPDWSRYKLSCELALLWEWRTASGQLKDMAARTLLLKLHKQGWIQLGMTFLRPWIDTTEDVPYPLEVKTRKLTHLAAEHGFVNPFPHRAVTDVLTTLRILSFYSTEEVERYAKAESKTLVANFERDDPEFEVKKDAVKRNGYRWTGAPEYQWKKSIKDFQVEEECAILAQGEIKVSVT